MPDSTHQPTELADLPRLSVSDVKASFRSVVDRATSGPVVIANHARAVAVVLSPEQYLALVRGAQQADEPLAALTRRFDERMRALSAPDASARLRALGASDPAELSRVAETPLLSG